MIRSYILQAFPDGDKLVNIDN